MLGRAGSLLGKRGAEGFTRNFKKTAPRAFSPFPWNERFYVILFLILLLDFLNSSIFFLSLSKGIWMVIFL